MRAQASVLRGSEAATTNPGYSASTNTLLERSCGPTWKQLLFHCSEVNIVFVVPQPIPPPYPFPSNQPTTQILITAAVIVKVDATSSWADRTPASMPPPSGALSLAAILAIAGVAAAAGSVHKFELVYSSPDQFAGIVLGDKFNVDQAQCLDLCDEDVACEGFTYYGGIVLRCKMFSSLTGLGPYDNIGSESWAKGEAYQPTIASQGEACNEYLPSVAPKDLVVCAGELVCTSEEGPGQISRIPEGICVQVSGLAEQCVDSVDYSTAILCEFPMICGAGGICERVIGAGDTCANDKGVIPGIRCPNGFACVPELQDYCVRVISKGSACDETEEVCDGTAVCHQGLCRELALAGAECHEKLAEQFAVFCQQGLTCVPIAPTLGSSGICRVIVGLGEGCTTGSLSNAADVGCIAGLQCHSVSTVSGTAGVCTSFVGITKNCNANGNVLCSGDLTCKDGICQNLASIGGTCTPNILAGALSIGCADDLVCYEDPAGALMGAQGICTSFVGITKSCNANGNVLCSGDLSCKEGICQNLAPIGSNCTPNILAGELSIGCADGLVCYEDPTGALMGAQGTCTSFVGITKSCNANGNVLCSGDLTCKKGVCQNLAPIGGSCTTGILSGALSVGCADGLVCYQEPLGAVMGAPGVCTSIVLVGEYCNASNSIVCGSGLSCIATACTRISDIGGACGGRYQVCTDSLTCKEGTCLNLSPAGGSCTIDVLSGALSVGCADGLVCHPSDNSIGSRALGSCTRYVGPGKTCNAATFVRCSPGLRCSDEGLCIEVASQGQQCAATSTVCDKGLECVIDPDTPTPPPVLYPSEKIAQYSLIFNGDKRFLTAFDTSVRLFKLTGNSNAAAAFTTYCRMTCSESQDCVGFFSYAPNARPRSYPLPSLFASRLFASHAQLWIVCGICNLAVCSLRHSTSVDVRLMLQV